MTRKIIAFLITILLVASPVYVYASPADNLDNRGQTESTAGITWDQINEMTQNSPNSLTPIQGLVLWMFAIIAFLKLAQKMDDLLQKLGLNVTQTGGRALGDLMVAGMALKNMGNVFSKGMGALGLGGGSGGGSSGGASAGTTGGGPSSAGGGPTSIPSGGPRGGASPAGSSPGGASPGGRTAPGSVPPSAAATGNSSTATSTTDGSNPAATSRSPVGRAVEWMRGDGFAQGAIRSGAKGGIIGVGAYSAKAGASKIGAAVSARYSNDGISSSSQSEENRSGSNTTSGNPFSADPAVNTEDFQTSRPVSGIEDNAAIPTTFNNEDYHDAMSIGGDSAAGYDYSSLNDEGLGEAGAYDAVASSQPIPTSADDGHNIGVDTNTASLTSADANSEIWQDTAPQNDLGGTPISSVNDEGWNDSELSSQPISSDVAADGTSSAESVQDVSAIQGSEISSQPMDSHIAQDSDSAPDNGVSGFSDSGSEIRQSSNVADTAADAGYTQETDPAPMPVHNQAIPSDFPHNAVPSNAINNNSSPDTVQNKAASPDIAAHVPIQSVIEQSNNSTTPALHAGSVQPSTETIRADSPVVVQAQSKSSAAPSEPVVSQQNNTTQSNITQYNNVTRVDASKQAHSASPSAPTSPTQNNYQPRPSEKGKSKNPSVKGRKRKR